MKRTRRWLAVLPLALCLTAFSGCESGASVKAYTRVEPVDAIKPVIDLAAFGLQGSEIDAAELELAGETVFRQIKVTGNQVTLADVTVPPDSYALALETTYTLKLFATSGARYQISFTTGGLQALTDLGARQVVMVPAMPEKGFHWPYFLALPSNRWRPLNESARRYLLVDTTNTGSSNNVAEMLSRARQAVVQASQPSMVVAEQLWAPMLYPAFPRPDVTYSYDGETNMFYTHALDRDTARLHLTLSGPAQADLTSKFRQAGFDVQTLTHLDLQLNAMIDHAIAYLNQYGHHMQPTKVMLVGYSASGTFTDRYTALHPDRVKAVASGGTVDEMVLPLAEVNGQKLIFPIGTSDYEEITGQTFDLAKHNQPARLIFMGESDQNNTVQYGDCYGIRERKLITDLWGLDVLPRAQALIELYGKSGGKGIFILQTYMKTFLAANRDGEEPVYPLPADANQLKYTLFK